VAVELRVADHRPKDVTPIAVAERLEQLLLLVRQLVVTKRIKAWRSL
jgi:hypothetical protein